jgi:hypothetical protein
MYIKILSPFDFTIHSLFFSGYSLGTTAKNGSGSIFAVAYTATQVKGCLLGLQNQPYIGKRSHGGLKNQAESWKN